MGITVSAEDQDAKVPRQCSICAHAQRDLVDRALLSGTSFRDIAGQFTVSRSALTRHKAEHLPAKLAKAHGAKELASADKLINELNGLKSKAVSLLMQAERAGDLRTALSGVREARGCIETLLEVEGEIDRRAQVNVLMVHPEWLALRTGILDALTSYPEARSAVLTAITEVGTHAGN